MLPKYILQVLYQYQVVDHGSFTRKQPNDWDSLLFLIFLLSPMCWSTVYSKIVAFSFMIIYKILFGPVFVPKSNNMDPAYTL